MNGKMRKEKLEELHQYIKELKTIKLEKTEQIPAFLTATTYLSTLTNNCTIKRERLLKNKKDGNAAIILPITKEHNTVLVVQPRVFTDRTVGIELPAGYIEKNELPIIAAARELKEETGYISSNIKLLTSYYQDQGCSGAKNYSFLALSCEKNYSQSLDPDEYIKYFECTFEEALELMELGYINDANSIITLEKSKQLVRR